MEKQKRVAAIHDISGFGKCSLTVALPVLSSVGLETCVIPTAVLSTHTGGFTGFTYRDLTEDILPMARHWHSLGLHFDAIYTGYLGSIEQIDLVREVVSLLRDEDTLVLADPAMADNGRLYSLFSPGFEQGMATLCADADIIIPNITEAAMLCGLNYPEQLTEAYTQMLLTELNHPCVILTGTGYEPGTTGVTLREGERQILYTHPKVGKNCHGTGDLFAACFTGALMQGKNKENAVQIAADFVCSAIRKTVDTPAHWYGVKFELALPDLIEALK